MENKNILGKLTINVAGEPLELDIISGELDRSYTAFNFNTESSEDINGYNLVVDVSDLSKDAARDLEKISNSMNDFFKVNLSFDGQDSSGTAKIAQVSSISGIGIDLEVHS